MLYLSEYISTDSTFSDVVIFVAFFFCNQENLSLSLKT